ncbi:hypothetical protein X777_04366 [Ooceraea biroi]|uniref:Uncharacterized protein n=1 Tax=Ooceraea biroi TaxID=2015173 RepID=A0A026WH96_OOCBI|nr:hypothetical protein X777_04366 [Ooceraea biroi]
MQLCEELKVSYERMGDCPENSNFPNPTIQSYMTPKREIIYETREETSNKTFMTIFSR